MQAVSNAFKTAALSADMTPVRKVTIQLVDNQSIGVALLPSANQSDSTFFPVSQAINGRNVYGAKWAFADPFAEGSGGRFLADGTLFPIETGQEGGWQGTILSDNSGNVSGGEDFIITYGSTVQISAVQFWADSFLGFPVDFTLDYDPTGVSGWTNIVTVTGNTLPTYVYLIGSAITIKRLRIHVTKINYGQQPVRLIEFQGGQFVDVTSGISQFEILQERFPEQATLVVGNASAGELNLSQDNTSGLWSPHSSSAYAQYLRANRKILVRVGYQYANGSTELIPLGTFYSMRWVAAAGETLSSTKAQDRMKKMREAQYRYCPLQINKTVSQCILQALLDFGLGVNEFSIETSSTVIPYAWATPTQTFFDYLQKLAAVDGGVVYFDENDIFRFQSANYLHNNSTVSQITLTDSNSLISLDDEWTDGETRNRIIVQVNSLKAAASAQLWALQEQVSVPPSTSITVITAAGTNVAIGNSGGGNYSEGQGFTPAQTGQLTQFTFTLTANFGAPTGDIDWEIRDDDGNQITPGVTILASGTKTPTPSSTNTVTVSNGPILIANTRYWLVLKPHVVQTATNYYTWQAQFTDAYAGGSVARSGDGGVTWTAFISSDAQCSFTINATVSITAVLPYGATGITTPSFTQSSTHISLLSWTAYGQSVLMVFSNSGGGAETLLTCTISGQSLQSDGGNLVIAETAILTSGVEKNPREYQYNNPYIQAKAVAATLSSNLLTIYSNPPARLHVETVGLPHLELGDRVTVISSQAGINADYWVIRHVFVDDGGFHSSLDLYAVV